MRNVISIAGTGRSGTNILKEIFGQHSKIATLPFEYRFMIDPKGIVDFYQSFTANWSPYKADYKIKELEEYLLSLSALSDEKREETNRIKSIDPKGLSLTPPPYSGWELNEWIPGYSDLVKTLIADLTEFQYSAVWPGLEANKANYQMSFAPKIDKATLAKKLELFTDKLFDAICEKQGKSIYLEDNTHNILFASDLKAIIPGMKLIHVVRDPRDVISSLQQQKWAPTALEHLISWYKSVMAQWEEEKARLDKSDFIEVKFEDILANPESEIKKLCAFVSIDFEPEMLQVKLDKPNNGRYKKNFSEQEIITLNVDLSKWLKLYEFKS
ncbi:MAG: sulfotransferase [Salibacteraceae bacterium]|jgi:hypothetical protein|nr:sulfotransferase [Salibacteraceae bacterium]MDP4764365.1 sulfotransferase [Salibacteraceae bacterium]